MISVKKIAIIAACPFPWPRGTPIRAFQIANSIAGLGHEVHVITYHLGESCQANFKIHRISDIPSYKKTSSGPSLRKLTTLNPQLVKLTRSLHRREQFDVVHAIHMEGLLVARRAIPQVPVIYDAHTSLRGELPDYFKMMPKSLIRALGSFLDKRIPKKADFIISVSGQLKQQLVNSGSVKEEQIAIIPNGVELDVFATRQLVEPNARQVIFTGNDAPYQRLDLLLDAFRQLTKVNKNAILKIVGHAPFKRERAYVQRYSLEERVHVIKADFQEELRQLASSSIAVSPRTNCDGMPQKVLNYMAAAKAVVACEGSSKVIEHNVTGIVVPNDDPISFAHVFHKLIEQPDQARTLGNAARAFVEKDYCWSKVATTTDEVYERVLQRHQKNQGRIEQSA